MRSDLGFTVVIIYCLLFSIRHSLFFIRYLLFIIYYQI